jgi:hypothetical protein
VLCNLTTSLHGSVPASDFFNVDVVIVMVVYSAGVLLQLIAMDHFTMDRASLSSGGLSRYKLPPRSAGVRISFTCLTGICLNYDF